MTSAGIELATAWVSIVPSMQGLRAGVAKGLGGVEADGAAAGRRFGKAFGSSAADGASSDLARLKAAADKAAASAGGAEAKLAKARQAQAQAAASVRTAEARLTEARSSNAEGSSRVLAAEERLGKVRQQQANANAAVVTAAGDLDRAQKESTKSAAAFEKQQARNNSAAGKARGAMTGFGSAAKGAFGMAMKAATPLVGLFAGVSAVGFFSDAIKGASDLEQSVGAVDAVFKGQAGAIKATAKGAAQSLGLTKNAYNEMATVLGAMLKNQGIADFTGETQKLIGVGADLAAQFGGSTQQAVDALGAAMRGESDPIERYGITLNETAVNAELAANGQDKLKGAALEQAKEQARIAIIMRKSADAQGAFARESDTLAGKQARLTALWGDFKTSIGTALLPVASGFLDVLMRLGGAVTGLYSRLTGGGQAVGTLARWFQQLAASPVGRWFQQLGQTIVGMVMPAFRETSAVVTGQLWPALQTIGQALVSAGRGFVGFAQTVIGSPVGQFIVNLFGSVIVGAVNGVINVFQGLVRVVSGVFQVIAGLVTGDWARVWGGLTTVAGGAIQAFVGFLQVWIIGRALGIFRAFIGGVAAFFQGLWAATGPAVAAVIGAFTALGAGAAWVVGTLVSSLGGVVSWLASTWSAGWQQASAQVAAAWQAVVQWTTAAWSAVAGAVSAGWAVVSPILSAIANAIGTVVGGAFKVLQVVVVAALGAIVLTVQWWWGVLSGIAQGVAGLFAATVIPAFQLFARIAVAAWTTVANAISTAWNWIVSNVLTPLYRWFTVTVIAGLNILLNGVRVVWNAVSSAISTAWNFIYSRVFQPLYRWVTATLTAGLNILLNGVRVVWDAVWTAISTAWNAINARVFQPLQRWLTVTLTAAMNIWRSIVDTVWSAVTRAISTAGKRITAVWDGLRKNLQRLWDFFKDVVAGIGRTWDGLREKVAAPVRYVVNNIIRDKLIAAWNAVATKVGLGRFEFAGMATGGTVKGRNTTATADNVPAMLTADEEVIRRRSARRMRRLHPGALEYINRYGSLPGFARGGRVRADSARPGPGMGARTYPLRGPAPGDAGVWRQLAAWITRAVPGARVTSSYRRTLTATGRVSNHARGLAIDVVGPSLAGIFNTIRSRFGGSSLELIYSPMGGAQISRGRPYNYTGVTRANHWDHVHWAMASMSGGPLPPGGAGFSMPNPVAEALKKITSPLFNGAKSLLDAITGRFGNSDWVDIVREGTKKPVTAMQEWLTRKIDEKFPAIMVGGSDPAGSGGAASAGSGPVRSQVQAAASKYGWGSGAAWNAIQWIIGRESSWNPNAKNPRSSAYGLFQMLNGTWGGTGIAKTSNPGLQAEAGMRYIRNRYGTPQKAQAFWQSRGWYGEGGRVDAGTPALFDRGGILLPGVHTVQNLTGKPETIRTWEQEQALQSRLGGAHITINGIRHDSVSEFAEALDYALIRARNAGRYASMGA